MNQLSIFFKAFTKQIFRSCGIPEERANIPLVFQDPIYGSKGQIFLWLWPISVRFWLDLKQEKYPKVQTTFFPCLFPEFLRLNTTSRLKREKNDGSSQAYFQILNQVNLMLVWLLSVDSVNFIEKSNQRNDFHWLHGTWNYHDNCPFHGTR